SEKKMVPPAHTTAKIVGHGIDGFDDTGPAVPSTVAVPAAEGLAGSRNPEGKAFGNLGNRSWIGGTNQIPNGRISRIINAAARIKWRTDARLRRATATPARASVIIAVAFTMIDNIMASSFPFGRARSRIEARRDLLLP